MNEFSLEQTLRLLSEKCDSTDCSFNGRFLDIHLDEDLANSLKKLGISYDVEDNKVDLGASSETDILLYFDIEDFIQRFKTLDLQSVNVFILKSESGLLASLKENAHTATGVITNYNSYKIALDFILNATNFISYANLANQEFVLITEKVVHVGYNPLEKGALKLDSLRTNLDRLQKSFENIEYQGFFKSTVIETIERVEKPDRFFEIVKIELGT